MLCTRHTPIILPTAIIFICHCIASILWTYLYNIIYYFIIIIKLLQNFQAIISISWRLTTVIHTSYNSSIQYQPCHLTGCIHHTLVQSEAFCNYSSFKDSLSNISYMASNDWIKVKSELERCRQFNIHSGIRLQAEKRHEKLQSVSWPTSERDTSQYHISEVTTWAKLLGNLIQWLRFPELLAKCSLHVQIKYNSETKANMLAMQPACYYSRNVYEKHGLTENLQTYSVNVTRADGNYFERSAVTFNAKVL